MQPGLEGLPLPDVGLGLVDEFPAGQSLDVLALVPQVVQGPLPVDLGDPLRFQSRQAGDLLRSELARGPSPFLLLS